MKGVREKGKEGLYVVSHAGADSAQLSGASCDLGQLHRDKGGFAT